MKSEVKTTPDWNEIKKTLSEKPKEVIVNNSSVLQFAKTRNVKTPDRGTPGSAGFDFYIPNQLTLKEMFEKNQLGGITYILKRSVVQPGQMEYEKTDSYHDHFDSCTLVEMHLQKHARILIPSGIYVKVPDNHAMIAFNKSGVASKLGLIAGSCVDGDTIIDTDKGFFTAITLTKQFITDNNIKIKAFDESTDSFVYTECDGFRPTSKKECIKITFENGEELICSEDHAIYINGEWIIAKDLIDIN